jgi:hypothetical protein
MQLDELVDIDKLGQRLAKEGSRVFSEWSATATEICGDRYKQIAILQMAYLEHVEPQIPAYKFVSFVEQLVRIMPTIENKKSLLRAEAFAERKFELVSPKE